MNYVWYKYSIKLVLTGIVNTLQLRTSNLSDLIPISFAIHLEVMASHWVSTVDNLGLPNQSFFFKGQLICH